MQFLTKSFSFKAGVFTAEMAELSRGGNRNIFHSVNEGGLRNGLTLVSDKTGKAVDFIINHIDWSPDHELMGWHLKPTVESIRSNPEVAGLKMLIIND